MVIKTENRWVPAFCLAILSFIAAIGCQPQTATSPSTTPESNAGTVAIYGAGASFPNPLYQRWFQEYNQIRPNVQISYDSVGSGAGVRRYLDRTVDFAASDVPLTKEEIQQFRAKFNALPLQVPLTGGAIVLAYNLGGNVQNLRLSREAYCGIVTGQIRNWNAPTIARANPSVTLPDQAISFVHRSDSSGTTFIFTNHIDAACPNWQVGTGKSVSWLVGIGGKGNEGVTATIQQTPGSIGYVEYSYATQNKLNIATLENRAGQYVAPSPESAARALEGQQAPESFVLLVPDPADQQAYPIVGLTWMLLYRRYENSAKIESIQDFVRWALAEGDQDAVQLGYLPLTDPIAQRVQATVEQGIITNPG
ncbi:phosphate ABC transporter substrate-binding protein PstS [Leptolyngbya sp. AN03gr2]|uniref:phosphate ABC transporter substrate-binding protein PstS n=1 Tax=unclassified Leptolyngbya TaxID=2650499 RepID=UPI003D31C296